MKYPPPVQLRARTDIEDQQDEREAGWARIHPQIDKQTGNVIRWASGKIFPGEEFTWRHPEWRGNELATRTRMGTVMCPPPPWAEPAEPEDAVAVALYEDWYIGGDPRLGLRPVRVSAKPPKRRRKARQAKGELLDEDEGAEGSDEDDQALVDAQAAGEGTKGGAE